MALSFLLCDDHPLVLEGLGAMISREPGCQVIGRAGDGAEAVRLAAASSPDVAVIDVAMTDMDGIETTVRIRRASPRTRIIALSMYADGHYLRRMLDAGASAYVLKNEASADLIRAIRCVLDGETFISPALAADADGSTQRAASVDEATLTEREREVLSLLAQGRRTRDIATDLGISAKTVETYRGHIMLKLRIDNLAGLVRFEIRAGIVPAE